MSESLASLIEDSIFPGLHTLCCWGRGGGRGRGRGGGGPWERGYSLCTHVAGLIGEQWGGEGEGKGRGEGEGEDPGNEATHCVHMLQA